MLGRGKWQIHSQARKEGGWVEAGSDATLLMSRQSVKKRNAAVAQRW